MDKKCYISVIICTYNRYESLKETLDSLKTLEDCKYFDYEIIIVDNNSNDKTKDVVYSCMPEFFGRLKYVFEQKQGLSYARNKGIEEANGEIIVFTDDDVIVDKKWLTNIVNCFKKYNCDGVGGRIIPLYPEKVPQWIKDYKHLLCGPIVAHDYGECDKIYGKEKMNPFVGASMAYKKEIFAECGLFNADLGVGKGMLGEDTDFFWRVLENNRVLYYCGEAMLFHKVDLNRVNIFYISNYFLKMGCSLLTIEYDQIVNEKVIYYFGIPRFFIKSLLANLVGIVYYLFNTEMRIKKWIALCVVLGKCCQSRQIFYKSINADKQKN